MFNVEVKRERPVQNLVVDAVHVRGGLGRMSVWWTRGGFERKQEAEHLWTKAFQGQVKSSWREFTKLELETPMVFEPGSTYGVYVHSADDGDDGIVYDNQRTNRATHDDEFVAVRPGLAHLSPQPFSGDGPWWGSPWRRQREFVGRLSYGARYILWDPRSHVAFPPTFRNAASTFFASLAIGWYGLPADVVLFIINMARFDWFENEQSANDAEAAPALPAPAPSTEPVDPEELLKRQRQRYVSDYSRFDQIADDDDNDSSSPDLISEDDDDESDDDDDDDVFT